MSVIMILTILFPSNCYADAECEHKNRFLLTRDNRNHFFRCSDCKYDWAESHNIGEGIDYTWDFDNQTCTANGRCTVCNYVVSETADATATVVQEKSCTLPELTTYSVTFGNSAFGTQTKENVQTAEATGHDLEAVEKKEASCTEDGYEAYWKCNTCEKLFSDEAGTVEINNRMDIPATGHSYGVVTYTWNTDNQKCTAERKCTVCDNAESETADATATVVQEKSCTLPELTTYSVTFGNSAFGIQTKENVQTAEATGHDLEAVEKKEASCTEDGYEAYWKCDTCEKLFSDEAGTVEINNRMDIPATGHSYGVVTYTWNTDNQKCTAERKCTVCDNAESETADATATVVQEKSCTLPELTTYSVTFGNSAFGIQTKENVQTAEATGHDLKAVKRKDAGCTEAGYEAYWRCQTCKKLFSDEAGTMEISNPTAIKATGHNLEKVEKKESGCTEDGHETYWRCQTCKKLFSDEAGTVEISNPTAIKATGHNLKKVEKKDATATEEGNSTYWFCDKCNKYFSDAKAETEIKKEDTVLAKLSTVNKKDTEASSAKTANATKVTSTTDKTTKSSPKTGDSTDVQLYVILMLVSIGAAAGTGAKRKLKTQR